MNSSLYCINTDPGKLSPNALIVGPTNSGKTQFLVDQLKSSYDESSTTIHRAALPDFRPQQDLRRFCGQRGSQKEVHAWLRHASFLFEGTNALIVLDDCAESKDVKARSLLGLAHGTRASACGC